MHFSADSADTAAPGVFQQRRDQTAADTLASPLWRHKQCNDVHGFTAKLGPPYIRRIRIPAQYAVALCDDDMTAVRGANDVLEHTARIVGCALGSDVGQ